MGKALCKEQSTFSVRPSLHVYGKQFIITLHLDDLGIQSALNKYYEKTFHKRATITKHFTVKEVEIGDIIPIEVWCSRPSSGFEFQPKGMYTCTIDKKIRKGSLFHKQLIIWSESKEAQDIVINFTCGPGDPEAISYRWTPGDSDNKLKVSVKYPDYSGRFEGRYRPDQTVFDVIVDILKENTDKEFKHIETNLGWIVHEDTEIWRIEEEGIYEHMTVVWEIGDAEAKSSSSHSAKMQSDGRSLLPDYSSDGESAPEVDGSIHLFNTDDRESSPPTAATSSTPSDTSGQTLSSSAPHTTVNVTVHTDNSKSETAGIKNVGGTVNKTNQDTTTHITGSNKKQ